MPERTDEGRKEGRKEGEKTEGMNDCSIEGVNEVTRMEEGTAGCSMAAYECSMSAV